MTQVAWNPYFFESITDSLPTAAEIHGDDGLGGVEGLLSGEDEAVKQKLAECEGKSVVMAIAEAARAMPGGEGDEGRLAIVATGTLTKCEHILLPSRSMATDR